MRYKFMFYLLTYLLTQFSDRLKFTMVNCPHDPPRRHWWWQVKNEAVSCLRWLTLASAAAGEAVDVFYLFYRRQLRYLSVRSLGRLADGTTKSRGSYRGIRQGEAVASYSVSHPDSEWSTHHILSMSTRLVIEPQNLIMVLLRENADTYTDTLRQREHCR